MSVTLKVTHGPYSATACFPITRDEIVVTISGPDHNERSLITIREHVLSSFRNARRDVRCECGESFNSGWKHECEVL